MNKSSKNPCRRLSLVKQTRLLAVRQPATEVVGGRTHPLLDILYTHLSSDAFSIECEKLVTILREYVVAPSGRLLNSNWDALFRFRRKTSRRHRNVVSTRRTDWMLTLRKGIAQTQGTYREQRKPHCLGDNVFFLIVKGLDMGENGLPDAPQEFKDDDRDLKKRRIMPTAEIYKNSCLST